MAANRIYIQVDFQSDAANANIDELNKNIKSIGSTSDQATQQAAGGMKSLSVQVQQTSSDFQNLAQAIGGLGLARIGAEAIKAGDDMGRLQLALRDLKGEMSSTGQLAAQMRTVGHDVPFSTEEVMQAALALKNYGMDVNDIARNVQNLATVMASRGLKGEQLQALVQTLGTMQTWGTVRPQQLARKLAEMGMTIQDVTGEQNLPKLKQMMRQQEISGAGLVDAFFKGVNERAQQTDISPQMVMITTQFQKMKDQADFTSQRIAQDFQGGPLQQMLDLATKVLNIFEGMPEPLRLAAEYLGLAAVAMVTISGAVKTIGLITSGTGFLKGLGALATRLGVGAGVGAAGTGLLEGGGLVAGGSAAGGSMAAILSVVGIGALVAAAGVVAAAVVQSLWKLVTAKTFMQAIDESWFSKAADAVFGPPARLAKQQAEAAKGSEPVPPYDATKARASLIVPPYAATEAALQSAKADLASAQEKEELSGIAAVHTKYQEIYDDLKQKRITDIRVISTYQQAEAIRVENKIRSMENETAKLTLENEKAAADELAKYQERTAKQAAGMAGAVPQDTLAKAAEVEARREQIIAAGANQAMQTRQDYALKEYAAHLALLNQRLAADTEATKANATERVRIWKEVYEPQVKALEATMRREDARAEQENDETLGQIRMKAFEESAKATTDYLKQARDEQRQNEISNIERQAQLAKQMVKTGEDQNAQMKVESIMKVAEIEIQAAQLVASRKKAYIEQDLRDQIAAADTLENRYKGTPYEADAARLAGQERVAAAQKAAGEIEKIDTDAATSAAQTRYQAFHDANEKIIEEQRQVYDKLKSAVGTVFDAMFEKGKSMWQSLADAAKKALMGMLKEIVTSNVAASMMKLFTGEQVTMESRGSFGSGPLGKLAGILTQHPVFHPLDQKTGLPPLVTTQPPPGTEGLPMYLMNPPGGQAGADAKRTIQVNEKRDVNVNVTGAGASSPAIAAAVAAAAGAPAGSGSSGTGGGYSTSSTISYEGGGSESFGSGGGGGGGSSFVSGGPSGIPGWGDIPGISGGGMGLPGGFGGGGIPGLSGLPGLGIGIATKAAAAGGLSWGTMGGPLLLGSAIGLKGAYSLGQSTNPIAKAAAIPVGAAAGVAGAVGLAALFPDLLGTAILGGPAGLIIAGAIGAAVGLYGLLHKTDAQKAHDAVQKAYGVDIKDQGVLNAIAQAAKKYGDFNTGVMSPEVQQIVHMYELSQGMNATGNLPRPMYSATLAQSSAAGGLQLQPVYSNGQVVASPYSGATTQQWSQGVYVQLNPQQANDLLTGKIVDAMNNNPGTVASANATGLSSGQSLTAQRNALIEPLTVMS